jgi:hypothetical protein
MSATYKLTKLALSALTAFALMTTASFALLGCDGEPSSDPPSLMNMTPNSMVSEGIEIRVDKDKFDHEVGTTPCPQHIGIISIKNMAHDEELTFKITRGHELEKATSVKTETGKIAKGADAKIDLFFNCSQTFDVAEQWIVEVYKTDGTRVGNLAINVKGKVNNGG